MSEMILGIDLGTTNSAVGVVDSGFPILLANEDGRRISPSAVWIGKDGSVEVGAKALRRRALEPERVVTSVKRFCKNESLANSPIDRFTPLPLGPPSILMNPESRCVPPDIRLIALCLLTLFSKTPKTEAAPVFEPLQAIELCPRNPQANLIQGSDGNFYGTTSSGGSSGMGTVFKMTPGGALTTLVHFTGPNGSTPLAGLIQGNDGNLYGTTSDGGIGAGGTVFRMTPDGVTTTLVDFTGANGGHPRASLIQGTDGNFYGTTDNGTYGTVFKMTPTGTLTTLTEFTGTNGSNPQTNLIQGSDGNFYGTTLKGGSTSGPYDYGDGTIFRLTPDGTLTTLVNFMGTNGESPSSGLIQGSDGNFYGTTSEGGSNVSAKYGTVFKMTPDGILTTLVNFTLSDGTNPLAGVVQGNDGNFYGTTSHGGINQAAGYGTAFKMTPDGTLSTLANFDRTNGNSPQAALIQGNDGNFYGTTFLGGSVSKTRWDGNGTIFKIMPQGTLTTLVNFAHVNGGGLQGGLVQSRDGNLYGTTAWGGISGAGTVFKMTQDGTLTTLVNFNYLDGSFPDGGLIQGRDGNFYGTTATGGSFGDGTVFKMTPGGTLTTLVNFSTYTSGKWPRSGVIEAADGNFYGTTQYGGTYDEGTVFRITPAGTFSTVSFTGANGSNPYARLVQASDGNFYGTTIDGDNNAGTVFKMTPNGAITTLVNFTGPNGMKPYGGLIQGSDGNFYGTTDYGGSSRVPGVSNGFGTVFKMTPSGNLTTLVNFTEPDFSNPMAGLIEGNDGNFYGTTTTGDVYAATYGKVFQMTPEGNLTSLVDFSGSNGSNPGFAGLIQGNDGNLYGTTTTGGTTSDGYPAGGGQIFRLRMDPIPAEITIESPGATPLTSGTASVSFGSITKTSSASMIFNIGNIGTTDLTGLAISLDGPNTADFSITSSPATLVAGPTGITTFTIRFSPQYAGARTATLHISSNDSDESPFDIVVTGTGVWPTPEISIAQPLGSNLVDGVAKKSFGTVKVGKSGTTKTFIIKNTGTAPLNSIAISKDGNHRKDFIITPAGKTSLAPGSSTSFKVKFQPTAKGTRNAWIHIRSNDADENKFDIKLTGLGTAK